VARTILIIDDSALMRRLVQLGLAATGIGPSTRPSPAPRASRWRPAHNPMRFLLDVEMPGLDSPPTLAILCARHLRSRDQHPR